MSDLERRLLWLIAIRLLVAASVAATYALTAAGGEGVVWSEPARALVAAVSLLTLLYLALGRLLRGRYVTAQAYAQFIGDVFLITQFIYVLGPTGRRYSILYLVVIGTAAVLLRRAAAQVVAGLAFLSYALPLLGQHYAISPLARVAGPPAPLRELLYDLAVHLVGFYGIAVLTSYLARDVARAERALRQRDADLARLQVLYRDVVRSISSGLITTDLDGVVTSLNRTGAEILGDEASAVVGRHITALGLFSPEAWREATESERRAADHGSGGPQMRFEREIDRGGENVPVGFSLTLLRDGEGAPRGYIVNYRDLTELRELQEQLRLQDRMAAVGKMAAGLAHEVGNPLAAISGSAQMLASSFEGDSSQRKLLEIAVRESQRLDRTVKGFLQFAGQRKRHPRPCDVAALLGEQVALLRNSSEVLPSHRIEAVFDPPALELLVDPDQISQLFWNLVRNALKAMPDGGELVISGRIEDDGYAIGVRDTGSGMSAEERANLFHPFKSFFDDGTGIGMAIVYRIVEEHGGEIRVDSAPGQGSEITVVLPREPAAERSVSTSPVETEETVS